MGKPDAARLIAAAAGLPELDPYWGPVAQSLEQAERLCGFAGNGEIAFAPRHQRCRRSLSRVAMIGSCRPPAISTGGRIASWLSRDVAERRSDATRLRAAQRLLLLGRRRAGGN